MAELSVNIPGVGDNINSTPIVILGPNGSGKTQLAQKITAANNASAISAQRRTWVDDQLPVHEGQTLQSQMRAQQSNWQSNPWQPTEDLSFILSDLVQEHSSLLTAQNQRAIDTDTPLPPVTGTKLMRLQAVWSRLFPTRRLEIRGFFPKVKRLDAADDAEHYPLRKMSDGERTILYMAARVLTADAPLLVVDEPELHLHSRLSVAFWDEAERLRPDCRFIYVTHDLHFALSRRHATVLVARAGVAAGSISVDALPASAATEILGAATLPFHTRRIFLFEGEPTAGLASAFFESWFDGGETVAIAAGNRRSVCAAVSGLRTIGVAGAEIIGLVDRDYDSQDVLGNLTTGVTVLPLHELESIFWDRDVVSTLAVYAGKELDAVWSAFRASLLTTFQGSALAFVVASRVRARVGDLFDGAFSGRQIANSVRETRDNHATALNALDLPGRVVTIFEEEEHRVREALGKEGNEMLAHPARKTHAGLAGRCARLRDAWGPDGPRHPIS